MGFFYFSASPLILFPIVFICTQILFNKGGELAFQLNKANYLSDRQPSWIADHQAMHGSLAKLYIVFFLCEDGPSSYLERV